MFKKIILTIAIVLTQTASVDASKLYVETVPPEISSFRERHIATLNALPALKRSDLVNAIAHLTADLSKTEDASLFSLKRFLKENKVIRNIGDIPKGEVLPVIYFHGVDAGQLCKSISALKKYCSDERRFSVEQLRATYYTLLYKTFLVKLRAVSQSLLEKSGKCFYDFYEGVIDSNDPKVVQGLWGTSLSFLDQIWMDQNFHPYFLTADIQGLDEIKRTATHTIDCIDLSFKNTVSKSSALDMKVLKARTYSIFSCMRIDMRCFQTMELAPILHSNVKFSPREIVQQKKKKKKKASKIKAPHVDNTLNSQVQVIELPIFMAPLLEFLNPFFESGLLDSERHQQFMELCKTISRTSKEPDEKTTVIISDLKRQISSREKKIESLRNHVRGLETGLAKSKESLTELKSDNNEQLLSIKALEKEVMQLSEQLEAAKLKLEKQPEPVFFESQILELEESLKLEKEKHQETLLSHRRAKLEKESERRKAAERESAALRDELTKLQAALAESQKMAEKERREHAKSKASNQRYEQQIRDLKNESAGLNRALEASGHQFNQLLQDLPLAEEIAWNAGIQEGYLFAVKAEQFRQQGMLQQQEQDSSEEQEN